MSVRRTSILVAAILATYGFARVAPAAPREAVKLHAHAFDLRDVRLLDGPFLHATELNRKALLRYEPDRLLARYRMEAGLKPKAEHYGGWEAQTIAGHSLGHYLSACALMFASTGDERFQERADYIVDELATCQKAQGDGYVSGIPGAKKIFLEEIAKGDIRSKGFDLNGLWVPLYTQHKVVAGLRDAHRICGNKTALEVARRYVDWLERTLSRLDDEQMQRILACEHGGINEVIADLYDDTGDRRYLELSRRFHHRAVLDPLSRKVDCLPGLHANTQIPKLVGVARRYLLTGDETDRRTAEFFWSRVVNHHSYVTGGHCINEHFGPPDQLNDRLGPNTTETCNVYNMLKLTRELFQWTALASAADFYERALYNHILSSQHPEDGRVIYNLTIEMGGYKRYQDPYGFTCCVGTGMENHSKYGDSIYFHDREGLYVNLFVASELTWEEKGVILRQETRFPDDDTTVLRFRCREPVALELRIRWPYWAEKGLQVRINGQPHSVVRRPSSWAVISKKWKTGDAVEVRIPKTLRLEGMPDNPKRVAVMYGPLVLAGDLGPVDTPEAGSPDFVPVLLLEGRAPDQWLEPIEGEPNTFRMVNVGRPRDVTLRPFYRTHERRYSIFWDIFTTEDWEAREVRYKAALERRKKLDAVTVDYFQPGEMRPERDHRLKGENTAAGVFRGRKWRHAVNGGWFAFDMRVDAEKPCDLVCTYWGSDAVNRKFDILVDGTKIATQKLEHNRPDKFFRVTYAFPGKLTRGKKNVRVRFQAHPGKWAGGLFGARIVWHADAEKLKDILEESGD